MAKAAPFRFDEVAPAAAHLVAIVTRVSTRLQVTDEGSLVTQLHRTRAQLDYRRALGEDWREVAVYELPAVSGKHALQHPELLRLQGDIGSGRVNTVVCTELSRVSRNVVEFLQFVDVLNEHRCGFICLKQAVDTTDGMGRLLLTVLVALAQFERETTASRTREAMGERAVRGLWK